MATFKDFLRRVRLKSIKIGPTSWDIEAPDAHEMLSLKKRVPEEAPTLIESAEEDLERLRKLIYALENFHSNPEGIYYIGQTLVACDSFLEDNGIIGEPLEACRRLMEAMDEDDRCSGSLCDPRLPIKKINDLKRSLKSLCHDISWFLKDI